MRMALEQALRTIVERQESLRTTFIQVGEEPCQIVHSTLPLDIPIADFASLPNPERTARVEAALHEEHSTPFDLTRGPLLRTRLLRLAQEDHLLLVTMHHIICDGWSVSILVREFAALYTEYVGGPAAALPVLPIQYADYALWQKSWLQGELLNQQIMYWRTLLGGSWSRRRFQPTIRARLCPPTKGLATIWSSLPSSRTLCVPSADAIIHRSL